MIAIAAVVAVVAGVGAAWLVTGRGDDDDRASATTRRDRNRTTTTADDVTTTTSAAPSTTAASTTSTTAAPTTTTSSTLPPIPEGAIDLGFGTYIPLADGWQRTTESDDVVTLSDGTANLTIQTLQRDPGEDPAGLAQEYVDLFDGDFASVSYSPTFLFSTYSGVVPSRSLGLYYRTFDAGDSLSGGLYLFQRTDGLTVVYDVWSDADAPASTYPDDGFNTFLDSFLSAPALGSSTPFSAVDPFRVQSVHPFVALEALVGYNAVPSLPIVETGAGYAILSNGTVDVYTNALSEAASAEDALGAIQASLLSARPGLTFDAPTINPQDSNQIVQASVSFTGAYPDGRTASGGLDVFWSATSRKAYSFARLWVSTPDGVEPFRADTTYIYQSVYDAVSAEVAANR